jgi:phosphoribosylformylglycinamidine cyclo-ligase
VGIDLVAMGVNDLLVHGAEPLFFLDYLATGRVVPEKIEAIVSGIAEGCRRAGCALIGGETAEMPDFYAPGEYDLAGFAVGVAERHRVINGSGIAPGDRLIGLASSGLHSNGYSLARAVLFERLGLNVTDRLEACGRSVAEELLEPTRIYVKSILAVLKEHPVKGMAHVTGGGITGNLPRILPEGCRARVRLKSWSVPPIFHLIQEGGAVEETEMLRTFNMGVGLILAVDREPAALIRERLAALGEVAWEIGEVIRGPGGVEYE